MTLRAQSKARLPEARNHIRHCILNNNEPARGVWQQAIVDLINVVCSEPEPQVADSSEPAPQPEAKVRCRCETDPQHPGGGCPECNPDGCNVSQAEAVRCFKQTDRNSIWVMTSETEGLFLCYHHTRYIHGSARSVRCLMESEQPISPTAARQLIADAGWPEGLAAFDERVATVRELRTVEPEPVVKEGLTTEEIDDLAAARFTLLDKLNAKLKVPNGTPMNARIDELLAAEQERDRLKAEVERLNGSVSLNRFTASLAVDSELKANKEIAALTTENTLLVARVAELEKAVPSER